MGVWVVRKGGCVGGEERWVCGWGGKVGVWMVS